MHPCLKTVGCGLTIALGIVTTALAQDHSRLDEQGQCFDITRHQGVLALNDHTVLVRVDANIYRLDLADRCPGLERPDSRITLVARGGSYVCGKLDYDLRVGENGPVASSIPCTIANQRRLTPPEIAAIPRHSRP